MQGYSYAGGTSRYEVPSYDDLGYVRPYSHSVTGAALASTPFHTDNHNYTASMKAAPIQSSSKVSNVANGPVLPPLRAPDGSMDRHQQQARCLRAPIATQPQPKEEKIGGVAAHLDYKMDEMVDFVSEMAQGMYGIYASKICLADIDMTRSVMHLRPSTRPEFRRYVNQVLTSTRLPSSTILLGLHYLAVRMTLLSARGKYTYGGGDVYNMLTTALLLGSKFLDDNTFQNRSWSDVSNIPVSKLNALESEWLQDIRWDMHFDPSDPKGFALWQRRWHTFKAASPTMKVDSLAESMKNTSLDGNFQSQHSTYPSVSSNARCTTNYQEASIVGPQWQAPHYEQWLPLAARSEYSLPSAPETGPNTPDYAAPNGFAYGSLPPIYPSLKMQAPLHTLPSNAPLHGYPTPQYNQYAGHGNHCSCSYCANQPDVYSMHYAYGQVIAG